MLSRIIRVAITLIAISLGLSATATTLIGSQYPTMVDQQGQPARYKLIVEEAFKRMQQPLQTHIMREAFVGSTLRAQRADGELAFLSLNEKDQRMHYSAPYLPVKLYLASRKQSVTDITEFYHLDGARIATENQFANTAELRLINTVKWSRNPATYDAFKQLADERADYMLADKLLINEFNLLLSNAKWPTLNLSPVALINANMHISIRKNTDAPTALLNRFNETIATMQKDGTYNRLLQVSWLSKDINDDGVADYITSSETQYAPFNEALLKNTFALDNTQPSASSVFVVNGEIFTSKEEMVSKLSGSPQAKRMSLLDATRYKRMLRDW